MIYKVKFLDDKSLELKSRVAPNGIEDSLQKELRSDLSMCLPVGLRILLSASALFGWRLYQLDVKSDFSKTGYVTRDVFVVAPREKKDSGN